MTGPSSLIIHNLGSTTATYVPVRTDLNLYIQVNMVQVCSSVSYSIGTPLRFFIITVFELWVIKVGCMWAEQFFFFHFYEKLIAV